MTFRCDLIDLQTLALEPTFLDGNQSKITKKCGVYYSVKTPLELIDEACMRYASTMEGRIQAVGRVLNFKKPPFLIAPFDFGVFPTMSPNRLDCVWIFNHPFEIVKVDKQKSRLEFRNDVSIPVNVSVYTIRQQQQRLHMITDFYRRIQQERKE